MQGGNPTDNKKSEFPPMGKQLNQPPAAKSLLGAKKEAGAWGEDWGSEPKLTAA